MQVIGIATDGRIVLAREGRMRGETTIEGIEADDAPAQAPSEATAALAANSPCKWQPIPNEELVSRAERNQTKGRSKALPPRPWGRGSSRGQNFVRSLWGRERREGVARPEFPAADRVVIHESATSI